MKSPNQISLEHLRVILFVEDILFDEEEKFVKGRLARRERLVELEIIGSADNGLMTDFLHHYYKKIGDIASINFFNLNFGCY